MGQLNHDSEAPLYEQVATLVSGMVDSGTLRPGERVPSLRKMSQRLKVSIATVSQAYAALEDQGVIAARPQSGFYVREARREAPQVPAMSRPRCQPRQVEVSTMMGSIFGALGQPDVVPLGVANPDAALLPAKALARAMHRAINRSPEQAVGYYFGQGVEKLRRQIAYRASDLGCELGPDDVVITSGCIEALALCLRTVARPGDVIAIESPAYFNILELIASLGMLALEIPTDSASGMSIDALGQALDWHRVAAVISVANFHNPTGALMPEDNKRRLVQMLAERDIPLIEDDLVGDLHFGEQRPRIARCFDPEGSTVLTCSSFSKTLAPGYRIGWVLPGCFHEELMQQKRITGASPTPPQLAVAELLSTGGYDRHLRRLRKAYREQVERMRYAIGECFPEGTRVSDPQGGFLFWVELPRRVDSVQLYLRALDEGVSIAPGILFSPTRKYQNFIRLSAGHRWDERIAEAVQTLGRLACEMAGS